jgi:hypothetical protein
MRVDRLFLLFLTIACLGGCPRDRSELGSLIEDADEREVAIQTTRPELGGIIKTHTRYVYSKRDGLHIDLPFLAGKELARLDPAVVQDQLGVEISRTDLGEGQEHVIMEKAEVWLLDGEMYRVRQELAHPMDIPTALGVSGFPLDLGMPIDGANEVRWNRTWNMRRLRLERSKAQPRLYTHIDVWRFLPREVH